jgi:hypothetical protein
MHEDVAPLGGAGTSPYLLEQQAAAYWHLEVGAERIKRAKDDLMKRLSNAASGTCSNRTYFTQQSTRHAVADSLATAVDDAGPKQPQKAAPEQKSTWTQQYSIRHGCDPDGEATCMNCKACHSERKPTMTSGPI